MPQYADNAVKVMLSIRAPARPVAETELSVATRHFSRTIWPAAAAGRLITELIYVGAAVVPPDKPLHAERLAIALPKLAEIVPV